MILIKCWVVVEVIFGSLDIFVFKNEKEIILDSVFDVSDSVIESLLLFIILSCDFVLVFK